MSDVIRVENLSKTYRLGTIGSRTLREDLNRAWSRLLRCPAAALDNNDARRSNGKVFRALRDVSFEVREGEVLGIIGRNGAGKSTLLKILSRVTAPTSGVARVKGRIASLLEVGTGFHPELSGRENIFLNGAILGMSRREIKAKFDEIVDFSGVEEFIDTPVKRYSSGMYVRLAFAVAAHLEPEILILDEVLAVGDAAFQRKCLGKMGAVAKAGRTVLFVSHNMDAISALCSTCCILDAGVSQGPMSALEAVSKYNSTAKFQDNLPLAEKPRYQHRKRLPIFSFLALGNETASNHIVFAGSAVEFLIQLKNFEDVTSPQVGLAITNSRGQRVLLFHTWYQSNLSLQAAQDLALTCKIPSLPLVPGEYSIDLLLGNGYEIIERVENATAITVQFRDLFSTGKLPNAAQSMLALPCQWAAAS